MKKILTRIALVAMALATIAGVTDAVAPRPVVEHVMAVSVLKRGNSGADVKTLQQKLKNWGYYSGKVDGIFGSQTVDAVKKFQKKNNLTADGIVGAKTLSALGMTLSSSSSTSKYSDADVQLLARLIYGEARGESYVGQVAVGAVVMNRIKSSSFPNTMSGVIYQGYAFTAVADGQINLTPDANAKKAARDAMNGWDPTYGAIYYYNPATATSSWIFSRKTTITIGNHVFAK